MTASVAGWIATGLTMVAAIMVAADLGRRITGIGFVVFTLASVAWIATAQLKGDTPLGVTNAMLLVVNAIGAWRWLVLRGAQGTNA